MKTRNFILIFVVAICAVMFLADAPGWADKPDKPPKVKPTPVPGGEDPPDNPVDGFWFWRWGHMDGPHDSAKALGISRDGRVAVGSTVVVDFVRAWRSDIDWAIATDDGVPPLYNELQVQESLGLVAEAAYAASNMTVDTCPYDKLAENFDWCGSLPVGTLTRGTVSYGAQWLWAYDDAATEDNFVAIPDFGGGLSDMVVNDVSVDDISTGSYILVGTGNTKTGMQAFRADTAVVDDDLVPIPVQLTITDMSDTEQTLQTSSAQAVSADGLIIAGFGGTKRGNKAFVTDTTLTNWADEEPILESYVLPAIDGGQWSEAYALTVTDEGVIYVAGRSDSPKGPQACIWFRDQADPELPWVVKGLGGLSKKKYDSVATGIVHRPGAADGDLMVVGFSESILYPSEAFVWSGNPVLEPDDGEEFIGYMYDLEYILIKTGVGEASLMGSSWILNEATGVALYEDGTARIVGWGINPERGVEAWVVTGFPTEELEPLFTHE